MCLETHYQHENSILGCLGKSGLQRKKSKLSQVCYFWVQSFYVIMDHTKKLHKIKQRKMYKWSLNSLKDKTSDLLYNTVYSKATATVPESNRRENCSTFYCVKTLVHRTIWDKLYFDKLYFRVFVLMLKTRNFPSIQKYLRSSTCPLTSFFSHCLYTFLDSKKTSRF
jgi:hypothetical protein